MGEFGIDIYILLYIKEITKRAYCIAQRPYPILCKDLYGKRV